MSKLKRKGMLLVVLGLLLSLLMFSGTAVAGLAAPARDAERNTGMTLMADEETDFNAYAKNCVSGDPAAGTSVVNDAIAHLEKLVGDSGYAEYMDCFVVTESLDDHLVKISDTEFRAEYKQLHDKYFGTTGLIATTPANAGVLLAQAKAEVLHLTVRLMFREIVTTTPYVVVGTVYQAAYDDLNTRYANFAIGSEDLQTVLDPLMVEYFGLASQLIEKAEDAETVNKAELIDELDWILAVLAVENGSYLNTSALNSFKYYRDAAANAANDADVLANYYLALGVISTWLGNNYNSVETKMLTALRKTMIHRPAADVTALPATTLKAEHVRFGDREVIFSVYTALNYLLGQSSLFSTELIELAEVLYQRAIHTFEIEIEVDTNIFDLVFGAGSDLLFYTINAQNNNEVTYKEFYLADGELNFEFEAEEGFDFDELNVSDWNGSAYNILPGHFVDFAGYQLNRGIFSLDFTGLTLIEQDWEDNKVVEYPGIGNWDETIYTNIFEFTFNKGKVEITIDEKVYFFNVIVIRDYETTATVTSGSGTYIKYVGNEFGATYDGAKGGFFFDDTTLPALVAGLAGFTNGTTAFDGYRLWNSTGAEVLPGIDGEIFTEADTDNGRITIYARFITVGNPEEATYTNSNHNDENVDFEYNESENAVVVSYKDVLDADFVAELGEETAFVEMFVKAPVSNAVGYYLTTSIDTYFDDGSTMIYGRPTKEVSGAPVLVTARDSIPLSVVGSNVGADHKIMLDFYNDDDSYLLNGYSYEVLVFWYGMGGEVVAVTGFTVVVSPYITYTVEFVDTLQKLTGANTVSVEVVYTNTLIEFEAYSGDVLEHTYSGTAAFINNTKLNINIGDKKIIEGKEYMFGGWMLEIEVDFGDGNPVAISIPLDYQAPIVSYALAGITLDPANTFAVEALWYAVETLDVTDIAVLSDYDEHDVEYVKTTGTDPVVTGAYVSLEGKYDRDWLATLEDGTNDVYSSILLFLTVPEDAESYTVNFKMLDGTFPMSGAIGTLDQHTFEGSTTPVDGILIDLVEFVFGTHNGTNYVWDFLFDAYSENFGTTVHNDVEYWVIPMSIVFEGDGMTGEVYEFTLYYKVYNEYTVSYNADGGSAVAAEVVAYGDSATEPTYPTKAGYVFDGWFVVTKNAKNEDVYTAWNFDAAIEGDITLVAKWTAWKYNVVYCSEYTDENNKVVFNTVSLEAGDLIGNNAANIIVKDGYAFAGWKFVDGVEGHLDNEFVDHTNTYNLISDFGMTGTGASVVLVAVWVQLDDMTGLELVNAPYGIIGEEGETGDDFAFIIDFEDVVDWDALVASGNVLYVTVSMNAPAGADSYYVVNTNSIAAIGAQLVAVNAGVAEFKVPVANRVNGKWVPFGTQNRNDPASVSTYFEIYFYENQNGQDVMVDAYNGNIVQANYQALNVRFDFNYKTGTAVTKDVKILYGNTIKETIELRETIPGYDTSTLYIPTGADVTKPGYDFRYWELSTERPNPTNNNADTNLTTPITRSLVLVAVNDVADVEISFLYYNYSPENTDPIGEEWVNALDALGKNIGPFAMKHDDLFTVPTPVLEGYEFQYWTTRVNPVPGATSEGSDFFAGKLDSKDNYLVNCENETEAGKIVLYAFFKTKTVEVEVSGDYSFDGADWTETANNTVFTLGYNTKLGVTLGSGLDKKETIRIETVTEGSTTTTTRYVFNGFWYVDSVGNRIEEYDADDYFTQSASIEAWWVEIESVTIIGGVPESMNNDGLVFDYKSLYIEDTIENRNQAHFVDNDITTGTIIKTKNVAGEIIDGEIYVLIKVEVPSNAADVEAFGDVTIVLDANNKEIRTAEDGTLYVVIKVVIGEVDGGVAVYGGTDFDGDMQLWVEDEDGVLIAVYFEDIAVADYLEFLAGNTPAYDDGYMGDRVEALWYWIKDIGYFSELSYTSGRVWELYQALKTNLEVAEAAGNADEMIRLYRQFYVDAMAQAPGYNWYLEFVKDYNNLDLRYYSEIMVTRAYQVFIDGSAAILDARDQAKTVYEKWRDILLGKSGTNQDVIDLWDELALAKTVSVKDITGFASTELKNNATKWTEYGKFEAAVNALLMPGGKIKRPADSEITMPEGFSSYREVYADILSQIAEIERVAKMYSDLYRVVVRVLQDLEAIQKQTKINVAHKFYAGTIKEIWDEFNDFAALCDPANDNSPTSRDYDTASERIRNAAAEGEALIRNYNEYGWEKFVETVNALYAQYEAGTLTAATITRAQKETLNEADYEHFLFVPSVKNQSQVVIAKGRLDIMMQMLVTPFESNVKTVVDMFKNKIAELAPNNEQNVIAKNAAKLIVWYKEVLFPAYASLTAGEKEDFNYQIAALKLREFDTENYAVTATLQGFFYFLEGAFDAAVDYGYLTLSGFNTEFSKNFLSLPAIKAHYLSDVPANATPAAIDGQMLLGEMGMQMFADSEPLPDVIVKIATYLAAYETNNGDLGAFLRFEHRFDLDYYANFYFTSANDDYYMVGLYLEVGAEDKIREMYEYSLGIFAITVVIDEYDADTEIILGDLLADLDGIAAADKSLVKTTTPGTGDNANITTYYFETWFANAANNTVTLGDYTITVDGDGAERRLTEVSLNEANLITANNTETVDANGWILTVDTTDWESNVIVITADSIRYNITFNPNLPTRRPEGTSVTLNPIERVASGYTVGEWYEEKNEGMDGFDAFLNTYALELDSHEFLGWFIDGNLDNEFFFKDVTDGDEATVITSDLTVVAMWKSHVYSIRVEYNDGVTNNVFTVVDIPWGYTVDEFVETLHAPGNHKFYLNTPERPDRWTFGGWYLVEGIEGNVVTFATEKFDFLNTVITHETVALETATAGEYEILIRAFWTETATPNIWLDESRTDAAADTELYTVADYKAEYTDNGDLYPVNHDATRVLVHTDLINWDGLNQDNADGFILSNNYAFVKVFFKGYNGAEKYNVKSVRGVQTVYATTLTNEVLGADGHVNLALAYCDADDDYKWVTLAGTQMFTVEAIDVNGKVIALYTFSIDVHAYVEYKASFIYHATNDLTNSKTESNREKSEIKFIYGATPVFSHIDAAKEINFANEQAVNNAVSGYEFLYWYSDATLDFDKYVDLADERLHKNTSYYAFWLAQTFTVRFRQADGTVIEEITVGLGYEIDYSFDHDDYLADEKNLFVGWEARNGEDVIPFLTSTLGSNDKITSELVKDGYIVIEQGAEYGILNLYLREVAPHQLLAKDFDFSGTGMEIIDYKDTVAMDYLGTMDWSKLVVHADEDCTDDECDNASHFAFNVQLALNNKYLTELNAINVFDADLDSWGLNLNAGMYNGSEQTNDLNKIAKMQFTVADSNGPRATGSRQQYLVGYGSNGSEINVYYFDQNYNIIGFGYALIGLRNYEEVIVNFNLNDVPADIGTEYEYGTVQGRALYGKGLDVLAMYNGLVAAEDKASNISEIFPKNLRTLIGFMLTDANGVSLLAKPRLYVLDDAFIATAKEMYPTWDVFSYGSLTFTGTTYLKAIYDAEDVNVYFYDYANANDILNGTAGYPENSTDSITVGFSTLIEGDDIPELTEFDGYDLDASYWTADSTWSLRLDANGNIVEESKPTPFDFANTYISGETKLYAFYMPHAYNISYIMNGVEVLNQNYYYGYVIEMPMYDVADIGNDSFVLAYWEDAEGNRFDFNQLVGMGNADFWAENDDRALVLYAVIAKIVPLPEASIEGFDLFDNDNIDDYTEIRDGYFEFSFYVEGFFGTDKFDKDISYRYWDENGIANYEFTIAAYDDGDDVAKTAVLQTRDGNGIRNDALTIVDGFVTVTFSISQFDTIERTFIFIWIDEQGDIIIAEYLDVKMNSYYDSVNTLMEDMMLTNFDSDEFKEKYESTQDFFAEIIEEFAPIVADLEENLDPVIVEKFREWLKGSFDGILDDLLEKKFEDIGGSPYLDETKQTIKNAVEIYKYRIQNAASFDEMFTAYEEAIGFIHHDIMRTAKEIYIGMLEDYVEGIIEQYGLDEEADADLIDELWTVFDVASAKIMSRNNLIEMDATLDKAKTDIKEMALENLRTNNTDKIENEPIPAAYRTGDEYAGARKLFENARAEALAKAAKATTTAEIDAIYAELTEKFGEIEAALAANEQLKNTALTQNYLESLLKEVLKELLDNPSQNIGPAGALSAQEMNTLVGNLMTNVVGRADLSDDAETDIKAAIVKYINTVNKIDIANDPRNEIAVAAAQLMADLGVILGQEDTRDRNAAAVVIEAIDALGKKAKKGDDKVIAARDKYDALTERQQNYVTNLYKLEGIENPSNLKILVWITIILLILLIIIAIIILILVRRRNNDGDDTDGREEQPKVETKKEEQKVADPKPVTPARDTYIVEKTTVIERTTVDEKKNEDEEVELEEEELEEDEIEDEEIEEVEEIDDEDDEVEPEEDDGTHAPTYNFNYNYTYATTTDHEEDDEEAKEKRKREPRKSFVERLVESHMTNKYYYSMLKNEILSYRTMRARMSKTIEKFNSGRIPVAKINLVGKTLRLYLALNPADYDDTLYHHKNVGDKRKYELTPLMVKVKSERSLNKALLLIAEAMSKVVTPNEKPVTKRRKFQEVDYVVQLRNNVATPIGARGMGHLIVNEITADGVDALPDYDATKCVEVREIPTIPNPVKESVSLETLEANFRSGEIIDLRALLKRKIVPAGTNFIKITAEGTLTKVFTVVANSYATVAVKMIALTGGIPVRLKGE